MANFLQSSVDAYQRGWQQRYGGGRRPGPMADPVANNPAIGAPLGADPHKSKAQPASKTTKYPTIADDPGAREANALWNTNEARWLQWQLQAHNRIQELAQSPDYNTRMNATQASYAMGRLQDDLDNLKKTRQKNPFDPEQTASLDAARKDINDSIGLIHEPFFPMPVTKSSPSDITQAPQAQPSPSPSSTPLQPKPGNTLMRPELSATPVAQNPAMGQPLGAGNFGQPNYQRRNAPEQYLQQLAQQNAPANVSGATPVPATNPAFVQPNYQQNIQPPQPQQQNVQPQAFIPPWLAAYAMMGARTPGPTPVANNPAMGAPLGAGDDSSDQSSNGNLSTADQLMMLMPWLLAVRNGGGAPVSSNPAMGAPLGAGLPIAISLNPEVGQFDASAIADFGSNIGQGMGGGGGGTSDIMGYLQSLFKGGGSGSGSGGKSGGGGLGSEIGGIFSAFANQPTFTYSSPNIPLPKPVTFTMPNLPQNTDVSY